MRTIDGGQLYKVKGMGSMLSMLNEDFMLATYEVHDEICEYDMYEKLHECNIGVTLRHLQLDFEITITMDQLVYYFEPFNSHEVILRPIANRNTITKYLKEELLVDDIDFGTGFVIKVNRSTFNEDDEDVVVKIQYAKTGFRFRQFATIARVMHMKELFQLFSNPRNRYISDMNLFDRVTVGKESDYSYFYGYSTVEGFCRIIRKNVNKQEFTLDRGNMSTVNELENINIYINTDELPEAFTKEVKEEDNTVGTFNVINTTNDLVFPKNINEGLLVTLKNGTTHMLVNNLSLVKGATFNVIEISKHGKIGVWGSSFDSTMDYYKGIEKLQLQIVRIDSINDFSLVNKVLLNK